METSGKLPEERATEIFMETSGKLPSFFKIVSGEQFTDKLKIPTDFLRHFQGSASPVTFHLQTAARTFPVRVEMVNNKFYFQKGLNEFLQANGLKYGQLLVFHYAGNLHFHVDIFGRSTCGELLAMSETEEADEEDDDVSGKSRKKYKTSSSGKARKKNKEAYWSKSEMKKKNRGGTSSPQSCIDKHLSCARMAAEAFRMKKPSAFLVSMKPSYMKYKSVNFPRSFVITLMAEQHPYGVTLWVKKSFGT